MPAARCSMCSLNFPYSHNGRDCPVCEVQKLDGLQNSDPDDPAVLNRAVTFAQFEREYGPADVDAYANQEVGIGPDGKPTIEVS